MNLNFKDKKESVYKLIYSDSFDDSEYSKVHLVEKEIDKSILNFIKDKKNSREFEGLEFFNDDSNMFKLVGLHNGSEDKIIYIYNYFNREIIPNVEKLYNLDNYSLYIKNIYYSHLLALNVGELKNVNMNKIINFNTNNYEFLVIVNLGEMFQLDISGNVFELDKNKSIGLSNKHSINFNKLNCQDILIITLSLFDGYKRFDYNKHPNQKYLL